MVARLRFFKFDPERHHQLREAAAEEFTARGYGATSLNKLIERPGLSKGHFYCYFDDKADLFAIVRRGQELGCIRRDVPEDLLVTPLFECGMTFRCWYLNHWDSLTPSQQESLATFGFDAMRRMLEPPAGSPGDPDAI